MNVKEIVSKYLIDNGFDGLYNDSECGCSLNDLMECEEYSKDCEPGYKHPGNEEYGYIIGSNKPEEKKHV